ncbi:MAG TPA: sigma-70 family RNA polymerase sigma factor [Polyangia bacterium]|jgi:RNA polymerase sigma-70 factor (ECF subfamily)|nr:sigma-70 family RNA polymerase sigma factor [Polyangia bacterium]
MTSPDTSSEADAKAPASEADAAASEADGAASEADGAQAASPSDDELIARARAKDFAAFETLLGRYEDKVYRLAFRIVRNETDAKEILQETFVSIWRKLDTFKGDSQFGSWVYRIATNAALMRLRSQRRHPEVSTEELPIGYLDNYGQPMPAGENWSKRPDDQLQSSELRTHIQTAVDALPDIYRTVFIVRDVEGLSTEETAAALGISVPTVKTRLHRARIALRDAIGGYFDRP